MMTKSYNSKEVFMVVLYNYMYIPDNCKYKSVKYNQTTDKLSSL